MRDLEPRRKEVPFTRNGVAHVAIARENNDGEAVSYAYALTAAENDHINAGGRWIYPSVELPDGLDEHTFGELDVLEGYINEATQTELEAYWRVRDAAWAEACTDADNIARLLTN